MTRPIRVAQVVGTVGSSGVESHLLALLPALDRDEIEVTLFVPGPGIMVERMHEQGVRVEEGAPTRKLALSEAARLAERWRGSYDLVHAHGPRVTFWAARSARAAKLPLVATVHELRWHSLAPGIKREAWVALEGVALHRADRVIAVSDAARSGLIARWPDLADRTVAVLGSAPLLSAGKQLPRANPGESSATFRLVTVGRFGREKGYDRLLWALARLADRGIDFTLEVIGAGALEAQLHSLADRLQLSSRVRWLGRDAHVEEVLLRAHAFVSATRSEMFGIAVLEAMALGLPVLAPAVGSLPELIVDGSTGALVLPEPESEVPERIAGVLERWWKDPEERARLGREAARRAREHFSPQALADGTAAVYRELLSDG